MILRALRLFAEIGIVLIAFGFLRTWQVQRNKNQALFTKGTVPDAKPDGFFNGTVVGIKASWIGKKFDAEKSTGINVFNNNKGERVDKYPFATTIDNGLLDKNLKVIKIIYDIPGNPFWLRCITDEIVQIAPNEYLGKIIIKIIPSYPFALGYFKLKK